MSERENVHVVPHEEGWAVKRAGAERASSVHVTKKEAVQEGTRLASQDRTELLVHDSKGQITQRNSFGNDPFPPKG